MFFRLTLPVNSPSFRYKIIGLKARNLGQMEKLKPCYKSSLKKFTDISLEIFCGTLSPKKVTPLLLALEIGPGQITWKLLNGYKSSKLIKLCPFHELTHYTVIYLPVTSRKKCSVYKN